MTTSSARLEPYRVTFLPAGPYPMGQPVHALGHASMDSLPLPGEWLTLNGRSYWVCRTEWGWRGWGPYVHVWVTDREPQARQRTQGLRLTGSMYCPPAVMAASDTTS